MSRSTDLPRAGRALTTALVTGACSGTGRAMATHIGSLGYDLVVRPDDLYSIGAVGLF